MSSSSSEELRFSAPGPARPKPALPPTSGRTAACAKSPSSSSSDCSDDDVPKQDADTADTSHSVADVAEVDSRVESNRSMELPLCPAAQGLPPKAEENPQRVTNKAKQADMANTLSREETKELVAARPKNLAVVRPKTPGLNSSPMDGSASRRMKGKVGRADAGSDRLRVVGSDGIAGAARNLNRAISDPDPSAQLRLTTSDGKKLRTTRTAPCPLSPAPRPQKKQPSTRGEPGSPMREGNTWMATKPSIALSRAPSSGTQSKLPKKKKDTAMRQNSSLNQNATGRMPKEDSRRKPMRSAEGEASDDRTQSPDGSPDSRGKPAAAQNRLVPQTTFDAKWQGLLGADPSPPATANRASESTSSSSSSDTSDDDEPPSCSLEQYELETDTRPPPPLKPPLPEKEHPVKSPKRGPTFDPSLDDKPRPRSRRMSSDDGPDIGHSPSLAERLRFPKALQRGMTGMVAVAKAESVSAAAREAKGFSQAWFSADRFQPPMHRTRSLDCVVKEPSMISKVVAKKLDAHKAKLDQSKPKSAPAKLWKRVFLRIHRFWDVDGDGKISLSDLLSARTSGKLVYDNLTNQHRPIFTVSWIVITSALWAHSSYRKGQDFMWTPGGLSYFFPDQTVLAVDGNCVDRRWQLWRLATYQFDHGHLMHISFNSMMVFGMGLPLEGFHGFWRTFFIFNLGVVGGGLAFLVTSPHYPVIGMSGGCYSLIGMQLASLMMNWKQVKYRRPTLISIVGSAALDIGFVFYGHLIFGGVQKSVAHSAHIGGYMSGLFCAIVFGRNLYWNPTERFAQGAIFMVTMVMVIFCLAWLTQWPLRALPSGDRWCWFRAVYDLPNVDRVMCVRCFSSACIKRWSTFVMKPANPIMCTEKSLWYYTEN